MSVRLRVPFVNPASCKNTTAGYTLDPKDPGVKVHEAVLLSAFIAGKKVRVLIVGCNNDRPVIISVGIGDPIIQ
jgi:hypothetical protein